jgi:hypothetical protein
MGRVRALRPSSAVHLAHLPCPPTTISTSSPPRHVCSRFAVGSRRLARGKLGSGLHCAAKFGRRLGAGASFQAAASVLLLRRARDGRAVSCLTALPPMLRLQGLLRHVGSQEGWQEAWDRACVLLASPVTPSLDLACLSTRASPRHGCSTSAEDGLTPCLSPLRSHLSAGFLFCLLALYGSTLRPVLVRSVRLSAASHSSSLCSPSPSTRRAPSRSQLLARPGPGRPRRLRVVGWSVLPTVTGLRPSFARLLTFSRLPSVGYLGVENPSLITGDPEDYYYVPKTYICASGHPGIIPLSGCIAS